jgi:hypothetical protein
MSAGEWAAVASAATLVAGSLAAATRLGYRAFSRLETAVKMVETHSVQLIPNGGSSVADAVRRTEGSVDRIGQDLAHVRERLAAVETLAGAANGNALAARAAIDSLATSLPRRRNDSATS